MVASACGIILQYRIEASVIPPNDWPEHAFRHYTESIKNVFARWYSNLTLRRA
jgi:hypothetical protein